MNNNFQSLLRLFGQSITDPAGAARILTARRYDRQTLWTLLALVSVLSVLLLAVSNLLVPVVVPEEMIVITPMTYGVIIAASLVMLVFALYWVGRMFGGTGHFPRDPIACCLAAGCRHGCAGFSDRRPSDTPCACRNGVDCGRTCPAVVHGAIHQCPAWL